MGKTLKGFIDKKPELTEAYREGLQAIKGGHRSKIKPQDTRKLEGSIDIDQALQKKDPHAARWDYLIGYDSTLHFIEVHPAESSNVDEVLKKLAWLEKWLGVRLDKNHCPKHIKCHWIATNGIGILPHIPSAKKISQLGLWPVKHLSL